MTRLPIFILILLLFGSCNADQSALIQEKVNTRLAEFVKKEKETCRAGLLAQAEKTVDSLLLAEAQLQLRDSLNRMRPGAPVIPPAVPPIDTLEVKPIFQKKN